MILKKTSLFIVFVGSVPMGGQAFQVLGSHKEPSSLSTQASSPINVVGPHGGSYSYTPENGGYTATLTTGSSYKEVFMPQNITVTIVRDDGTLEVIGPESGFITSTNPDYTPVTWGNISENNGVYYFSTPSSYYWNNQYVPITATYDPSSDELNVTGVNDWRTLSYNTADKTGTFSSSMYPLVSGSVSYEGQGQGSLSYTSLNGLTINYNEPGYSSKFYVTGSPYYPNTGYLYATSYDPSKGIITYDYYSPNHPYDPYPAYGTVEVYYDNTTGTVSYKYN